MTNELVTAIENLFDDFTIHPSGAYIIDHRGDTAIVISASNERKASVTFGTRAKISGADTEIANALRDWRNRPQL